MLIDLHTHSSGISKCCRIPAEKVIQAAKENGIDGIVLTNHYQKNYITDGDVPAFARRYVEEYHYAKECAKKVDFPVFFGIEVTMERYGGVHLLVYGVEEDFPLQYPTLFDMTQEELYRLVKAHGGTTIQAHPYRQNIDRMLDPALMDGIEINCHPLYEGTHLDALVAFAKAHDLLLTCGGDFHADTHRPRCGVYLPEGIQSSREICAYLAATDEIRLCVQEVTERVSFDVSYRRDKIL
ncbi:MAG: PHP domain-containing protein [Clostridia bacterium]|nr:PHP domain-containing protein [Clostridia bacterium]